MKNWDEISIGVVGSGAIGSLLGARLSQKFQKVGFIGRQGPEAVRYSIVSGRDKEDFSFPRLESFQILLICVKAFQIEDLPVIHRKIFEHQNLKSVVILSNGIIDHVLQDYLRYDFSLHLGMTTFGVRKLQPQTWQVVNPETGKVIWGDDHQLNQWELSFIEKTKSLGFIWQKEASSARRRKWLFNTSLNSICGRFQLQKNEQALCYREDLLALMAEAYQLGSEFWGSWDFSLDSLSDELFHLIEQTKDNLNSMAFDIQSGRRTEVDFLSGLVDYALKPQSYPELLRITAEIRELEGGLKNN